MNRFYVLTLSAALLFSHPVLARFLSVGVGMSRTVRIQGLSRAAVANSKVLHVKAIPPSTLLLTGVQVGRTTVRAWTPKGQAEPLEIRVVSSEAEGASLPTRANEVVKVALEFLELNETFTRNLGIQWPEAIQFTANSTLQGAAQMTGLNYEVGFSSATGWIHHLVDEGWAKILAKPELYVRLGEQAVFQSGGEFPVATDTQSFGEYHRYVEWKNYGLTAKVRPQSGDGLHVSSDVDLEISELNKDDAVDGIPSLTRRHLITKMDSVDGQTVILSGLVRQNESGDKSSLPILSSIPLLGPLLFSSHRRERESSELLMAVTFTLATNSREQLELERFHGRFRKEHGS